ncbi:MAG: ferritin [Candidatus Neomarinimicrobiota bacterium]
MLSENVEKILNKQIADEAYSSRLYLAMAVWCDHSSLSGAAHFFYHQSDEERGHMKRIIQYVNRVGGRVVISDTKGPPVEYKSLKDVIEEAYEHEKSMTVAIVKLVDTSLEKKDYATFDFLQWFVTEQVEEEAMLKSLLDRFNLVGTDAHGTFIMDKEMGSREA